MGVEDIMKDQCKDTMEKVSQMGRELIELADDGESDCDDGCAVMFGVVRDCGYKILAQVEKERLVHGDQQQKVV